MLIRLTSPKKRFLLFNLYLDKHQIQFHYPQRINGLDTFKGIIFIKKGSNDKTTTE